MGNQMFQYVVAKAMSKITHGPLSLIIAKYSKQKERRVFRLFDAVEDNGFSKVINEPHILDKNPQPYKLVNLIRRAFFVVFTCLANLVLLAIGISPLRVWTNSMWVSAKK
jgi:hypothetical protein